MEWMCRLNKSYFFLSFLAFWGINIWVAMLLLEEKEMVFHIVYC